MEVKYLYSNHLKKLRVSIDQIFCNAMLCQLELQKIDQRSQALTFYLYNNLIPSEVKDMGKCGSQLVLFTKEGLQHKKYGLQLVYSDVIFRKFKLSLPRIKEKVDFEKLKIIKDWKERNSDNIEGDKIELKTLKDWSNAKQTLLSAYHNSVFFEFVSSGKNWWEYEFLTEKEVKAKRQNKKSKEKKNHLERRTSSVDSGYINLKDSPGPLNQVISEAESNDFCTSEDQSGVNSFHENPNLEGMNKKLVVVQPSSFEAEFERNWDEKMVTEPGYLGVDNQLVVVQLNSSDLDFERLNDITELIQFDHDSGNNALLLSDDDFLRILDEVITAKLGYPALTNLKGMVKVLELLQPGSCNADYEQRWEDIKKFLESESEPPDNTETFSSGDEDFCREWDIFMESEPICFGTTKKKFPLFEFYEECLFGGICFLIFKPTGYELKYDMEEDYKLPIDFFPGIIAGKDLLEKLTSGHVSGMQLIDGFLVLYLETGIRSDTLAYIELSSFVSDDKLFVGIDHFIFYPTKF